MTIISTPRCVKREKLPIFGLANLASRRECRPFAALYLAVFDWKVQRFCWPKGTSLECAESIYVKITETACVSEDGEFKRFACTGPYSFLKHANR